MFKMAIGSFASAFAMFVAGFLYFAGPIALTGYSHASEAQSAAVQAALAANLPQTGTYMIPDPSTQSGTTLYGKGPVATVHFNTMGFSLESMDGMIWGFVLYLVAAILMAGGLSHVPDFRGRLVVIACFAVAASSLTILTDPIFLHQDWAYAIFAFVGSVLILCVGGFVLARWFLPSAAQKPQEIAGG